MKLTQKVADAARPGQPPVGVTQRKDGRYSLDDHEVAGLKLCVFPGGAKTWQVRYRLGRGRTAPEKLASIGSLQELTVDAARDRAAEVKLAGRQGRDLLHEQTPVNGLTVAGLWQEYVAEMSPHWSWRTRKLYVGGGRVGGAKMGRGGMSALFLDAFGKHPAATLQRHRVVALVTSMQATATTANRVLRLLRQLYGWARDTGRLPRECDPCVRIKPFPECDTAGRKLTLDELGRLGAAIHQLAGHTRHLFILMALTGCRPGELCSLKWSQVDFHDRVIRLGGAGDVATKTRKPRIVPLNVAAYALLEGVYAGREDKAGVWVFPSPTSTTGYLTSYGDAWEKVKKLSGVTARPYDFRHTFGSHSGEESMLAAQQLLGHDKLATTQRYVHPDFGPLRETSERVGAAVSAAMGVN